MREAPPNASSGLQAPPAFLERPKEEYFQEVGRELLIPCSARGDPPPTVTWTKVRPCAHCLRCPPAPPPPAGPRDRGCGKGVWGEPELPGETRGALGEGWLPVSSGLTGGSAGGPRAAGPGPGGQQQQPHSAAPDQGGPRALGVHGQQRCGPGGHLHASLRAGSVAPEPLGLQGAVVGRGPPSSSSFSPSRRALTSLLHSPYPGTSPHVVTNVSVVPLPQSANVSWEPGFDGGYLQRFSIWYTPLCVTCPPDSPGSPGLSPSPPSQPRPKVHPEESEVTLEGEGRGAVSSPVHEVSPFAPVLQGQAS